MLAVAELALKTSGYSRKVVHPPHRSMKNCFNIFLEFQPILDEISGIPKENKKTRHRGTSFQKKLSGIPRIIENRA